MPEQMTFDVANNLESTKMKIEALNKSCQRVNGPRKPKIQVLQSQIAALIDRWNELERITCEVVTAAEVESERLAKMRDHTDEALIGYVLRRLYRHPGSSLNQLKIACFSGNGQNRNTVLASRYRPLLQRLEDDKLIRSFVSTKSYGFNGGGRYQTIYHLTDAGRDVMLKDYQPKAGKSLHAYQ